MFQYCIDALETEKRKYSDDDDLYICIEDAISKLNHYYDQMSPAVGVSLFLDPQNKGKLLALMGWEESWIETSRQSFDIAYDFYSKKYRQQQPAPSIIPQKRKAVTGGYSTWQSKLVSIDAGDEEQHDDEVSQYFNTPRSKTAALQFWKVNQYKFPILSAMAKDFLAVQASSVPSERAFSAGGNLVSKRRCSMAGKTIEMTQFLKYYFRDT